MVEQLHLKIQGSEAAQGMINFMEDKLKDLQKELAHYKKIKDKWTVANTIFRTAGISVSGVLGGTTAASLAPPQLEPYYLLPLLIFLFLLLL